MSKEIFSLLDLCLGIKETIRDSFSDLFWVRAEIAEFRENRNGHCYLDLIEKQGNSDQIAARVKAIIWSYSYKMLKPYFETSTGRNLSNGLKVLVQVSVEYQEVFGLSLIVRDIDPAYTLGDLEQRKRETIARLKDEGVLEMNKELPLPQVIQRIAVISSSTAAGYGDFINQLENNQYGIKFYHQLFDAIMQGEQASASIAGAFDRIYERVSLFDAVVIIRGGGASIDLLCFDDYWLAYNITQFPLPVITGIGHERDTTIADLAAHTSLKTPTAVAEFIIAKAAGFLDRIEQYSELLETIVYDELDRQKQRIKSITSGFISETNMLLESKKQEINTFAKQLPLITNHFFHNRKSGLNMFGNKIETAFKQTVIRNKTHLDTKSGQLKLLTRSLVAHQKQRLLYFEKSNQLHNPIEILKRGYSITLFNGKPVKTAAELQSGDSVETWFEKGKAVSIVKEIKE